MNFFHVPVDLPESPVAVVSGEVVPGVLTRTVGGLSILCMTFWKRSPYFVVLDPNTPHCFESVFAYRSLLGVPPKMTIQNPGNVPLD